MGSIQLQSTVVAVDDQVSSALDDEEVILHLESGVYYGLNTVGAAVWERIQTPCRVTPLCDQLHSEFDVERDRLERDVLELLHDMSDEGLVQIATPSA